jgi:hypothetical protein
MEQDKPVRMCNTVRGKCPKHGETREIPGGCILYKNNKIY